MPLLSKLLGIWAINRTVSTATPLFARLLIGMAAMTLYAITAIILLSIIIVGAVWLGYTELLIWGFSPSSAIVVLGAILLAFLAAIMIKLRTQFINLHRISSKLMYMQSPAVSRINNVTNAFLDGFNDNIPSRAS